MITVIIQSRLGSTRLPRKALMPIGGKSMIQHVVNTAKLAITPRLGDKVVVAMPRDDKELLAHLSTKDVNRDIYYTLGEEDDVLDRFYQAYSEHGGDILVRITGDCPLIDSQVISDAIVYYSYMFCDYVSNRPAYPDGFDVQVFSPEALERTWKEASDSYDREHVCSYMTEENGFNVKLMETEIPWGEIKLSVDTLKELERVREVYDQYGDDFSVDMVAYLEE